ncbi:MAG: transcriptional repressor [Rhodocyclaceae bacterium]|nr:transcriptional repressor [Rhodocyclaceae bacterium]
MSRTPPSSAESLIAAHGGRITRTRVAVLEVLLAADQSLTHDEIAGALAGQGFRHDRVTLYRTLDWLIEAGVAHKMAGDDRARRFGVAASGPHEHAHFHCDRCGKVVCLEGLQPAVAVNLPGGYQLDRAELVLHGACPNCGESTQSTSSNP